MVLVVVKKVEKLTKLDKILIGVAVLNGIISLFATVNTLYNSRKIYELKLRVGEISLRETRTEMGIEQKERRGYGLLSDTSKRLKVLEKTGEMDIRKKGRLLRASGKVYGNTSKRFRDISEFGSGFRTKRRLRESGNALYSSVL